MGSDMMCVVEMRGGEGKSVKREEVKKEGGERIERGERKQRKKGVGVWERDVVGSERGLAGPRLLPQQLD